MGDEDNRISYLVDFLKDKTPCSSDGDTLFYEELLQRSVKSGNLYGQALAYIKFSRVFQDMQQTEQYTECIKNAYAIAVQENYLDILIRYYNLEGIRYMQNYDDANALSMYLKGIHLATQLANYSLCAIFYNNIAEIFFGNYDYDKAILYYLKALHTLEMMIGSDSEPYRKAFLENLISSYYLKNDLEHAKQYLQEYKNIACDDSIRPFAQEEAELKVLMLEKKKEKALENALALLDNVGASHVDEHLLFYAYSFLCDIFLEFKKKDEAWLCFSKLEQMKTGLNQNFALETQKRKIRYYQIFDITNDSVFKEFFELTLQWELHNTKAVSNSLSAAVSLYETEKETRLMKKERKNLEEFIMYDPLTGIYNRRKYDQIVTSCLHKNDVREIAYIMIDIDYFKEYNDYYGHPKGDVVLKSVSELIREALPQQAYLARYGGDEFACLLVNRSVQEVDRFMKNIHDNLEEKKLEHVKARNGNHLSLSLGAFYTRKNKNTSIDELIKRADDALYHVKNNGRNGYRIFHENG